MNSIKYPTPPVGYIRHAQAILEFDSCQELSKIKSPTLVLGGQEDILVPPENFKILADRIPNAKLKIFKDSNHLFISQVREKVVPVILEFLSELETV